MNKQLSKITSFLEKNWLWVIGLVIVVIAAYQYIEGKNIFKNPFSGGGSRNYAAPSDYGDNGGEMSSDGTVRAAPPEGQIEMPQSISGMVGTQVSGGGAATKNIDPAELLPRDSNSEWTGTSGSGDIANVNLLDAGHLTGVNTVGSSLRNSNLQLRSEPANPRVDTGPWGGSTIEPDLNRRQLEIGSNA